MYCFIWASFTFRYFDDDDSNITRITNGSIENFNGFIKRTNEIDFPNNYISKNISTIKGMCKSYLNSFDKKLKKNEKTEANEIEKDDIKNSDDIRFCEENYNKKLKQPNHLGNKHHGYQKPVSLENIFSRNASKPNEQMSDSIGNQGKHFNFIFNLKLFFSFFNFFKVIDTINIDENDNLLEVECISNEKKKECEEKKLLIQSCSNLKPNLDLNTIMMKVHGFSLRKVALEMLLNNGYLQETVSIF